MAIRPARLNAVGGFTPTPFFMILALLERFDRLKWTCGWRLSLGDERNLG